MGTAAKLAADYGYGARAPWAAFRASEYDMKERASLSGLFPQVNNEPTSNTRNALVKAFEDPEVDREEQRLDSTTQFCCADGLELVARLRAMQGDGEAERGAADAATALREAAKRLI